MVFGELRLDRLTRNVSRQGQRLKLTPKEYALLEYFLLNPERPVSRTELLEKVWDLHFDPGSNVVDAHLARLRAKLEKAGLERPRIESVRGVGFTLTLDPDGVG